MYWITGNIDVSLTSPRSLLVEDHSIFQDAMKEQGWTFTRSDRDPMSEDYSLRYKDGPDQAFSRWYTDSARWEAARYLPARLLEMYEQLGVVSRGQALPLCDHCPSHDSCWLGMEDRKATRSNNPEWSEVSLPWIGEKYSDCRIVVIGINPYEAGGLQFFPTLVTEAIEELNSRKKNVTFGAYAGTTLWHRIGEIAVELLSVWQNDLDFSRLAPSETYTSLAFTNHIKCSPLSKNDRSRPSNAMWKNCGQTILNKELNILRPNIIVVLGRGENMYAVDHRVLDQRADWFYESKYIRFGQAFIDGRRVVVLNVPHPAMGIGKSAAIPQEVANMASRYQNEIKQIVGRY